jgi:hypothetical protein
MRANTSQSARRPRWLSLFSTSPLSAAISGGFASGWNVRSNSSSTSPSHRVEIVAAAVVAHELTPSIVGTKRAAIIPIRLVRFT